MAKWHMVIPSLDHHTLEVLEHKVRRSGRGVEDYRSEGKQIEVKSPDVCGQGTDMVYFTPGVDEVSDDCEIENPPE